MQQANNVVSSVQLGQTLCDYLVFDLDLLTRDVVTFFVLDEVVADLHMLRDHKILFFKDLVLLSRLQLNDRVLYLCCKVAENEVIRHHQALDALRRHLQFQWEVVLHRCEFGQTQKFVKFLLVFRVFKSCNDQIA